MGKAGASAFIRARNSPGSHFCLIPFKILEQRRIDGQCLRLLIGLESFVNRESGDCFPSYVRLRQRTGLSHQAIRRATQILQKEGLISVRRERKSGGGFFNDYDLAGLWNLLPPPRGHTSDPELCTLPDTSMHSSGLHSKHTSSVEVELEGTSNQKKQLEVRESAKRAPSQWPKRTHQKDDPLSPREFIEDWCIWYEQCFHVKTNWTRNQWAQYHRQFAKAMSLYGASRILAMMRAYWDCGEKKGYQITIDGFFRQQDSLYQRTKFRE